MQSVENKIKHLSKLIPVLKQIPEQDRITVFKQSFKSTGYRLFLILALCLFVAVFYFNLDNILRYKELERGGILSRSIHFLKELGLSFFLPIMGVFLVLVVGRNFFVKQQVKKYLRDKNY